MGVVAAREQRLRHGLYRRVALEVALDAAEPGTVRSRRTDLTFILVPIQDKQARLAMEFSPGCWG